MKLKVLVNLNMRKGAGTSFGVIRTLKPGEILPYYSMKDLPDGTKWVNLGTNKWSCYKTKSGKTYCQILEDTGNTESKPVNQPNPGSQTPKEEIKDTESAKGLDGDVLAQEEARRLALAKGVDASMRLFGLGHQFLAHNDTRISDTNDLGRVFTETLIMEAPVVYIKPGTSNFLPKMNQTEKENFLQSIVGVMSGNEYAKDAMNRITSSHKGSDPLKYFEFKPVFNDYMRRVNMLCRVCAVFLGIENEQVPWVSNKMTFGLYDWRYYKFGNMYNNAPITPDSKVNPEDKKSNTSGFLSLDTIKSACNKITDDKNYIQYYVDANMSYSESTSNSTSSSMIEQQITSLEGLSKELQVLTGMTGVDVYGASSEFSSGLDDIVNKYVRGDGALSKMVHSITGTANTIVQGGNIILPEIWQDSAFGKNYQFSINLHTPYGNTMSWYLNICVPLMHLMAMALPHQLTANTMKMPYLVKMFSPGWFSCEMGIIDSLSIEKGPSNDTWAANGLPSEVRVTVSVKDLYSSLALPASYKPSEFMNNSGLVEYLMTTCGMNLSHPEIDTTLNFLKTLYAGSIKEAVVSKPHQVVEKIKYDIAKKLKIIDY